MWLRGVEWVDVDEDLPNRGDEIGNFGVCGGAGEDVVCARE